jgi:hypothetical protein
MRTKLEQTKMVQLLEPYIKLGSNSGDNYHLNLASLHVRGDYTRGVSLPPYTLEVVENHYITRFPDGCKGIKK